jgi:hypothetical protein
MTQQSFEDNLGELHNLQDIPKNALIKWEKFHCGKPNCRRFHGPYLVAYFRIKGKLHKKYIGKSIDEYNDRRLAKLLGVSVADLDKPIDEIEAKRKVM